MPPLKHKSVPARTAAIMVRSTLSRAENTVGTNAPGAGRAGTFVAINGAANSDGVAVMVGTAGIRTDIINIRAGNTLDQVRGAHRAEANPPPAIRRPLTSRAALQMGAIAAHADTPAPVSCITASNPTH
jgi:hypothetical protein